jgi:hypothetical protein
MRRILPFCICVLLTPVNPCATIVHDEFDDGVIDAGAWNITTPFSGSHIPRVALGKFLFFPQQNVSFLAAKRRISESFSIEPLRFCARP